MTESIFKEQVTKGLKAHTRMYVCTLTPTYCGMRKQTWEQTMEDEQHASDEAMAAKHPELLFYVCLQSGVTSESFSVKTFLW